MLAHEKILGFDVQIHQFQLEVQVCEMVQDQIDSVLQILWVTERVKCLIQEGDRGVIKKDFWVFR
jgi:hypothetical protein